MATGRWLSLLFSATFSALLTPCCGQQFQQIDLTTLTCTMSSIYSANDGTSLDCRGAINGNTGTTWIPKDNPGANCLYTTLGDNPPYWQVNLGQSRNIHRIIIYPIGDRKNHMQNGTVSVDGKDVYRFCGSQSCIDNPHIITLSPPLSGQIVKLTGRSYKYLAMCELQVEDCARNRYGVGCTQVCSSGCLDDGVTTACDSITGHCLKGCESGWWGDKCDRECPEQCDGPCDAGDGHCSTCVGQFAPPLCTACVPGWYGDQCDRECGQYCLPDNNGHKTCGRTNGHCTLGCVEGWYQQTCTEPCGKNCDRGCERDTGVCHACQPGWYSEQCDQQCSEYCLPDDNGNTTCGQTNGHCTSGCVQGWYQQTCTEPCGENCDGGCDRDTGVCNGCRAGFYGKQCVAPCGNGCINKICNRQNGACSCEFLWTPPSCTECQDGYYGREWCRPCGHCSNNTVCDNNNGHCPDGCDDGYGGDLCDVTASESSDTQDVGIIVGSIIGGLLGAGLLTGLFILLAACIVRKRRSREVPSSADPSGRRPEVEFSPENALHDMEGDKTETTDPDGNYSRLENYENPDDIRPYSMLQTDRGHNTNINIQGDKETVLYHNTSTTGHEVAIC